ncbi:tRNA cyclic N6-threonylcarbamoyladenosine(37) synthase TcdA [Marinicellulosiphila megalodicopiae]|uniref:tRNA cyclic N6-threonylcarbamoyladenosine(37) synthase TcdA n=1 Tax=Marinicellulosiphila megalodicopiae TaxID=2724896 RepID=UPI003BB21975
MKERFGGIERLYGTQVFQAFLQTHVCIIGIGGVGSWVAEGLARSGIGEITLIDMDDICVTNINRQIHALTSNVGELKTEAMAARLKDINPDIKVNIEDCFLTRENTRELIGEKYDYIFDAIDSVKPKAQLIWHCKRNKIPLLCAGGAGGLVDPSKIEICDLFKTFNDALAAKTRNWLRREYNYSTNPKRKLDVEFVFSTEQARFPKADGTVCHSKSEMEGNIKLDCSTGFGSSTAVTASFGMRAVGHILNKIAKKVEV